jgi:hypothetical protein
MAESCSPPTPPPADSLRPLAGIMGPGELASMKALYAASRPDADTDVPTDLSTPFARAVKHMFERGWPNKAGGVPPRPISLDYESAVAAKAARDKKPTDQKLAMPWSPPIPWHAELVEADSREAYRCALAYALTGKKAYADVVKRIVAAWRDNIPGFERIDDNNAPLEVGWAFGNLLKALLVLENGRPTSALTRREKADALGFIDDVARDWLYTESLLPADEKKNVCTPDFYVNLKEQSDHKKKWGCVDNGVYFGNWQTTMLETRMLLAVFRGGAEGRAEYDTSLHYARTVLRAFTKRDGAKAMTAETCRDVFHAGFGIAGLVEMAEIAWQQGDPRLYAEDAMRLKDVVEFHAKINRGLLDNDDVGCDTRYGTLKAPDNVQPYHEVAYHHYRRRLGQPMSETRKLIENGPRDGDKDSVPDGQGYDSYTLQWGYGTITHREAPCK